MDQIGGKVQPVDPADRELYERQHTPISLGTATADYMFDGDFSLTVSSILPIDGMQQLKVEQSVAADAA